MNNITKYNKKNIGGTLRMHAGKRREPEMLPEMEKKICPRLQDCNMCQF